MRFVRLTSFALVLSVAGLSSSFALCVSACTDEVPNASDSHACHESTADVSIAADEGACPHGSEVVEQGDITRDERAPLIIAQPVVSLGAAVAPALTVAARATAVPPARPLTSSSILRI